MATSRSPNYPSMSLGKAIEALRPVFKQENRNKMSKLVLAKHLGSNSLNGRVIGRIGALRAYGLIEGPGDAMRVSDDAIVLLNAPEGSPERRAALDRCAFNPAVFRALREESPDLTNPPSEENIRYSLVKRGFTPSAGAKAAKSYLSTISLISGNPNPDTDDEPEDEEPIHYQQSETRRDPAAPKPSSRTGVQRAEFPLIEGIARIEFPDGMSAESYDDLETWLNLVLRRAKRSVV